MRVVRTVRALEPECLVNRWAGTRSHFAAQGIAAGQSLNTPMVTTPCLRILSLLFTVSLRARRIAHRPAVKTCICQVPRKLRRVFHSLPCLHTAAASTWASSELDPAVHHTKTPTPTFVSFSLAQCSAALLAVLLSSSIMEKPLVLRPGPGSSCLRLSSRARVLSRLLGISVCRTKGLRAAPSCGCVLIDCKVATCLSPTARHLLYILFQCS
jgi:hypothetical protein